MSQQRQRANRLAFLCGLYPVVIVGGFILGSGFGRWSHQTAILFESTATTGPEWGRLIPEINLSGRTFDEGVHDLAVASAAPVDVQWQELPRYLQGTTRAPEISRLHNVGLRQALTVLIPLYKKDDFGS